MCCSSMIHVLCGSPVKHEQRVKEWIKAKSVFSVISLIYNQNSILNYQRKRIRLISDNKGILRKIDQFGRDYAFYNNSIKSILYFI
jgi:hypothetical protein